MPSDVKLFKKEGVWDIDFENGDIALTNGLDTALYMSIFCHARATADEVADVLQRRGHVSDIFNNVQGRQVGSKVWRYTEKIVNTEQNAELIKIACKDGIQWLVDDNIIESFNIDITRAISQIEIDITLKITKTESLYTQAFINTFNGN